MHKVLRILLFLAPNMHFLLLRMYRNFVGSCGYCPSPLSLIGQIVCWCLKCHGLAVYGYFRENRVAKLLL